MAINSVAFSGNLTRDPELREAGGKPVVSLRVGGKNYGKPVFVDVTAWDKLAELLNDACSKGSPIAVSGRLQYREWETNDGQKRNALEIVATDVQLPPREVTDDVEF